MDQELMDTLQLILSKQNELEAQIKALHERIEKLHDPVLQAYLEQAIQVKPSPPSLEDLVKKAKKKSS